jgi:hypothetical protein
VETRISKKLGMVLRRNPQELTLLAKRGHRESGKLLDKKDEKRKNTGALGED